MGKLDVQTREYVQDNQVFADICNYMLFQGEQVIQPDQLREKDPVELILPFQNENITIPIQKFRDLLKKISIKESDKVTFMIVGIENQQEVHYAMVVRNMLYDAIDYASQIKEITKKNRRSKALKNAGEFLSGMKKDDKILPVITIVIYWGSSKWDGAKTLHEMLDVDSRMLKYIPNYEINLIAPEEIDDFDAFHTEFGLIMECLKNSDNKNALLQMIEKKRERFSNMERNAATLIAELTKIKIDVEHEKGKVIDVCKAVEDLISDSVEEGKTMERVELIRNNMDELSVDMIAGILRQENKYVNEIISLMKQYPEENDEQIANRYRNM